MLPPVSLHAQVLVTANQTATNLAQKLVGTGVTIMNPTLTCAAIANGVFSVTSSNLGLDSGIVLTSGRAKTVGLNYGVNSAAINFASTGNNTAGDPQLSALAGNNAVTHDACILQFDFRPTGDTIKFGYVFGSEEYTSFTCTEFNDVFGFFISGPGYVTPQNLALVPGTNIPVSVNSVNGATPANNFGISVCNAMGPGSPFNQYFVENINGSTITYDGLTTVLQAIASVTPCDTYHLKLGVADVGDDAYDSGVFIKAGSLSSNTVNITPVGLGGGLGSVPYCVRGCLPGKFIFVASSPAADSQVFHYQIAGTAVDGYDYAPIADSVVIPADSTSDTLYIYPLSVPPTGPKTIELQILSPVGCNGANTIVDSAELIIYDSFNVHVITPDTGICIGQSVNIMAQSDSLLVYQWTPAAGLNNTTILQPTATPTVTTTYQVSAVFPGAGCAPSHSELTITVDSLPVINVKHSDTICLGSPIQFDATVTPATQTFTYLWSPGSGLSDPTSSSPVCTPQQLQDVTYTITANNLVPNCSSFDTVHLHVLPNDFSLFNGDSTICLGASVPISASGDPEFTYVWTPTTGVSDPNIINPIITSPDTTTYTITASYPGCPNMPHQLTLNTQLLIADIITPDTGFCIYQPVQIHAGANADVISYTWSPADGLDSPDVLQPMFFENTPGNYTYTLTIKTNIGCIGVDSFTITTYPIVTLVVSPTDTTIPYGSSVQLTAANTNTDALYYFWTPNNGSLDDPNIGDPLATPLDSTTYLVIGMNQYGCKDSANVKVGINFEMSAVVPNAFSPNGDGRNDFFKMTNIKYQRLIDFSVYDRWGQRVFHTTNPDEGWDGKLNGQPQEMGTYNYMISIVLPDGNEKLYRGAVTLVR